MKTTDDIETISIETLADWKRNKQAFHLIDTLPEENYQSVHIPGAINACVYEVNFMKKIRELLPDPLEGVVLYGNGGKSMDAITAAGKLNRQGYRKVFVFTGGLRQWCTAGYEVIGEAISVSDDREPAYVLEEGRYHVETAESRISWTGRNANGAHTGTMEIAEGEVNAYNGEIAGVMDVDMTSISNIDLEGDEYQPVLIDHLESDDFFFINLFPTAQFYFTSVTPIPEATPTEPNYAVNGRLKIRGIGKSIEFQATVNPLPENRVAAQAGFDIDRTNWGIIYGSTRFFDHLGKHKVYDHISFDVRLVLVRDDA
ncbi:MAG: hypothetical protein HKM93_12210 [Desulfobacteraceae bacterium]|nr:hypothetical protein [Desulfobacteraceae bacterium]